VSEKRVGFSKLEWGFATSIWVGEKDIQQELALQNVSFAQTLRSWLQKREELT
jgi:hypothetical protein